MQDLRPMIAEVAALRYEARKARKASQEAAAALRTAEEKFDIASRALHTELSKQIDALTPNSERIGPG